MCDKCKENFYNYPMCEGKMLQMLTNYNTKMKLVNTATAACH